MFHSVVDIALWTALHSVSLATHRFDALPLPQAAPAPTEAKPPPKWTGSITAGAIVTTGNSETRSANATADAVYEREKDRITLGFLWVYADEKNSTNSWNLTDRKTSGRAKYDYFLSKKTYLFANASGEADEAAALDLRVIVGAGAGHQFIDNEKWKFAGEVGVSYFDENYVGTADDKDYVAARLAANTNYEHDKTWSFGHTLEGYPSLEDADDFYGRSDLRVKLTFTESMLAQFQWILDYDNTPATGKDRVDNRYLVSVGWKF